MGVSLGVLLERLIDLWCHNPVYSEALAVPSRVAVRIGVVDDDCLNVDGPTAWIGWPGRSGQSVADGDAECQYPQQPEEFDQFHVYAANQASCESDCGTTHLRGGRAVEPDSIIGSYGTRRVKQAQLIVLHHGP